MHSNYCALHATIHKCDNGDTNRKVEAIHKREIYLEQRIKEWEAKQK